MTPALSVFLWVFLGAGPDDPEVRREARSLRDQAYRLLLEDDYAGGIAKLEEAYERVPNPGLLLNVVIAYRRWPGHCEEAYAAYARFEAACGAECEFRRDGAQQLAALDAKCQAPVTFVSPTPTEVFLDGKAVGRTPLTHRLRPGSHRVATSTGTPFALAVEPERPQTVWLGPPALSAAPPPAAETPLRDAFTHGLLGLGSGALVVGATFTGLAVDSASTLSGARAAGAPPEEIRRLSERQDRDAAVAVVGWTLAATSGAAALMLWLTKPGEPEPEDDAPRVTVGVGSATLRF